MLFLCWNRNYLHCLLYFHVIRLLLCHLNVEALRNHIFCLSSYLFWHDGIVFNIKLSYFIQRKEFNLQIWRSWGQSHSIPWICYYVFIVTIQVEKVSDRHFVITNLKLVDDWKKDKFILPVWLSIRLVMWHILNSA